MAAGIEELALPCMIIEDLFISQKLVVAPRSSTPTSSGSANTSQSHLSKVNDISGPSELSPGLGQYTAQDTMARVPSPPPRAGLPPSYSSTLQAVWLLNHASTDSDSASDISDDLPFKPRSSSTATKPRLPNPRLVK
jgi:hypothetical protein